MTNASDYQKGYRAGLRKSTREIARLNSELRRKFDEREERLFLQCLETVLKNCGHWKIGGEEINNAEGYCRLAKIFADNAITELNR